MGVFKDIDGNIVHFENVRELKLDTEIDIATGETVGYLVLHDDSTYRVNAATYHAIEEALKNS